MASGFISQNVKSVNSGAGAVKEVESVLVAGGGEHFCTQGNKLLQILGRERLENVLSCSLIKCRASSICC